MNYIKAVRLWGLRKTIEKMYMVGELKFGVHVGTDSNGNEYFENREYVFGTHRWVEYKDIHNYDSSSVTPEWHGWLHHVHDTPPVSLPDEGQYGRTTAIDDCPVDTHVGSPSIEFSGNHNLSTFRPRGYGFGNLYQEWGEPELYYKQPGHPGNPISDRGGRFDPSPEYDCADPNEGPKIKEPLRSLDEN